MNMHAPAGTSLIADLRPEARNAPESGIVEVVNHGRLKPGLIPLWVGEGDLPTPDFIVRAANKSLAEGETFYTWQRGIPELREALARYHTALYGRPFNMDRFYVTGSGMQSVQIAVRLIAGVGDELIIPTPAWPNFAAAMGIAGANPVCVPMQFKDGRFTLDLQKLEAAISPRTRAFVINSPANPTGWTATRDELAAILAIARKHGIWIIADEIYARFVYDGSPRAASFHDVMEQEDRILFVQTFSKNWAMTGWRVGWIEVPPAFGQIVENLIQYSTSGSPVFVQRAAIAALEEGEPFVAEQIARATEGRRIVAEGLKATNRINLQAPDGAFYQFFSVDGWTDSRKLAIELVDTANVGLAPGTAFGPGGETGLRFCFARKASDLVEAVARLQKALAG
ncbi:Aspartate aminotransferase [Bosea sp. 62]|uniref:pyridoxal phosphate-dependent aminotransferase n=1 Tax=unclassified Bosea (in: a-proteobacteria) TaxID=2653178 RepID=UPI001255F67C|nr:MULTISPECIES: pyridoxal phosphate-dependent aminotransferase [unclassified Bosea (in: a-proteobacteria)]CAD5291317.1 Aspartate aminotransferase [Bosea sp. 7B]CAD5299729.1 Aspartate aminotransferase [Bosea sp. 21B]CAD5299865.1 Aspartate aminotransferase [Bosea sp. 46]VVT61752.1 Aspartate/methionine/tyrosine aminotransferase [Bosea sp. EC-HK365B]VXB03719.1 Aspartate aminotransferase [Bosea sp. 127]